MIFWRRLTNLPTLTLRRHLWRIHPRRWGRHVDNLPLNKPIFLLGVQGGGINVTGANVASP